MYKNSDNFYNDEHNNDDNKIWIKIIGITYVILILILSFKIDLR
jgi:hypothetical protein